MTPQLNWWSHPHSKLDMYEDLQELLIEHYMCMYVCLRDACVLDSVMGHSYFIVMSSVCVYLVNMRSFICPMTVVHYGVRACVYILLT